MTTITRIGAVFLHPQPGVYGNILWLGELSAEHRAILSAALAAIRSKGYFASAFPEGDGVTFNSIDGFDYQPDVALLDFSGAFPFLALELLDPKEGQAKALARLAGGRVVRCRYLAPVEHLRLDAPFELGQTRFHAWRARTLVEGGSIRPGGALPPRTGCSPIYLEADVADVARGSAPGLPMDFGSVLRPGAGERGPLDQAREVAPAAWVDPEAKQVRPTHG